MAEPLKPGNDAPKSGDYNVVGPRGGIAKTGVTMKKGDTLPPTPKKNQTYKKA
ncbi:YjzC family protein [Paenibacillus motobuensis]|uniref:YjzC family protein n=1 Tax=Paenibacillus motobuensis TaxID=295324 RepID=UPI0036301704